MADVVVIGAGISGAATAWELARGGASVVLLDRYGPAAMASGWTLAGVRQSGRHPAEMPLARAAVALWAGLGETLGADVSYRRGGNLRLARTEAEVAVIERLVAEQAADGLDVTLLRGAAAITAVAPAVSPAVLAASYCRSDGDADPKAAVQGFVDAAERAGAVMRFGERALAIEVSRGRVTGVRTDRGTIPAGRVVLAAGVFGNELLAPFGLRVPLDVRIVSVVRSAPMPPLLAQVIGVANADVAGRQEANGRFRVSSGGRPWRGAVVDGTARDGGGRDVPAPVVHPEAGGLSDAIARFAEAVPAFRDAPVEAVWAGLIDLTPDALPVIDAPAGVEGLVLAMGFSGHGFCLGPVTGKILAALARDETPDLPIAPFRLDRFDGWNGPSEAATLHG